MNLDRVHRDRITKIVARLDDGVVPSADQIFACKGVVETLEADKLLLESFDIEQVRAVLPFSPNLYVEICPECILQSSYEEFAALVKSGLVRPILIAPYAQYHPEITELIVGYDHISYHEYRFYRSMLVSAHSTGQLCSECVGRRHNTLLDIVKGKRGAPELRQQISHAFRSLHPYVHPDFTLLDEMENALRERNKPALDQLLALASSIQSLRSAQALASSIVIDASDLEMLPEGITEEADSSRLLALGLRQQMASGLGLVIPLDLPIDRFIGLVRDFQPQIAGLLDQEIQDVEEKCNSGAVDRAISRVAEINREIERVKGLKRHGALEVSVAFFKEHKALTAAALLATALGVSGSLLGCAGALVTGSAADAARRRGWIGKDAKWLDSNDAVRRLGQMVHRDLQPGLDSLVAKYAGTELTAIRVMSLRRIIAGRAASTSKKRIA